MAGYLTSYSRDRSPHITLKMNSGPCKTSIDTTTCKCSGGIFEPFAPGYDATDAVLQLCEGCDHPLGQHEGGKEWVKQAFRNEVAPAPVINCLTEEKTFLFPRPSLIAATKERLFETGFVYIRGTPATGKTSALNLLEIDLEKDGYSVLYIDSWLQSQVESTGGWKNYIARQAQHDGKPEFLWERGQKTVILLDEGQTSFWDLRWWNTIKNHHSPLGPYIAVAACHGSARNSPTVVTSELITPFTYSDSQQIALRPSDVPWCTFAAAGLLLQPNETSALVDWWTNQHSRINKPSDDLKQLLHRVSDGHVGVIDTLLHLIYRVCKPIRAELANEDGPMDAAIVRRNLLSDVNVLDNLLVGFRCARGLPARDQISNIAVVSVFKHLLYGEFPQDNAGINACYKAGWIYYAPSDNPPYRFTSPLHEWWIRSFLPPATKVPPSYHTIEQMLEAAVRLFRRDNVTEALRCSKPPKEDIYRKELYRSLSILFLGTKLVSPELGIGLGKGECIDFYVSHFKWGLELVRDGNELTEHYRRFHSTGAYGPFANSDMVDEWRVVNFTTKRSNTQPDMPKLINVEFTDDFHVVQMFDNLRVPITEPFHLLSSSLSLPSSA